MKKIYYIITCTILVLFLAGISFMLYGKYGNTITTKQPITSNMQLFDFMDKLTQNRLTTKEDVEKIIDTKLIKNETTSNNYFNIYEAKPEKTFKKLEFREGENGFLLIAYLSDNNTETISSSDLNAKFGSNTGKINVPYPNDPTEIEFYQNYELPNGVKLMFGIKNNVVTSITIDFT